MPNDCCFALDGRTNLCVNRELLCVEETLSANMQDKLSTREFWPTLKFAARTMYEDSKCQLTQPLDIFRHTVPKTPRRVGRSVFKPPPEDNPQRLDSLHTAWFGYYTSVRPGESGAMLDIYFSATAFYDSTPQVKFVEGLLEVESTKYHYITSKHKELTDKLKGFVATGATKGFRAMKANVRRA